MIFQQRISFQYPKTLAFQLLLLWPNLDFWPLRDAVSNNSQARWSKAGNLQQMESRTQAFGAPQTPHSSRTHNQQRGENASHPFSAGWVPHCACGAAEMRQAAPGTSPPSVSSESFIFFPPFSFCLCLHFKVKKKSGYNSKYVRLAPKIC